MGSQAGDASRIWPLAVALIALAAFPHVGGKFYVDLALTTMILAIFALSLELLVGHTGLVSFGHAAFFGIGAYTSTLLLIHFGISPWLGLIASGVLGGVAAFAISLPTMRLRGHYFALATLAFGEVMRVIGNSWSDLTGGPVGISVPFAKPSFVMFQFADTRTYYWLMLAAFIVVTAVFVAIKHSRTGYRLQAIKENADAAEVIGVDTTRTKIIAAIVSGALTACLGTFYAQFQYFFDPDTVFGVASVSIRVAMIAIVGGIGTAAGPLLGALFVIPLEEAANQVFSAQVAGLAQLVFGTLLIIVILVEPRGFIVLWQRLVARRKPGGP